MLSIDINKPKKKTQKNNNFEPNDYYHRLSIPYYVFLKKKTERFIYKGNEKIYFNNRKNAFKKILRAEVLKFFDNIE
ncbi:MAG: hypothetical protein KGD57_07915 [Candidatus Lokiarchaeota archaeon]|nr:hypothetical protein [Candidatus Lokiarchaeota archaeon]